jgi:hypothetical protein
MLLKHWIDYQGKCQGLRFSFESICIQLMSDQKWCDGRM